MSPCLRRVRTASGATAVQVVARERGQRRIVEHLGSARDQAGLAALTEVGRRRIAQTQGQGVLDSRPSRLRPAGPGWWWGVSASGLLWQVLTQAL
ncbi:hypothetical protein [Actinomyces oris]|uniref:hypothetical protein n=1 Tax=Actinomyces oris TaxID=544580 RepID=UPI0011787D13|nr:hypothetical protein [Actinomyces oris]